MARILWTATHQLGNLASAGPIVSELTRRGHEVVALSTPEAAPDVSSLGARFRAHRRVRPYDWRRRDAVPVRLDDYSFENYRRLLLDPVPDEMDDVLDVVGEERFELVLTDAMSYGAGFAAEKAGLPWACYVSFAFDESLSFEGDAFRRSWDAMRARLGLRPDPRPSSETPRLWLSPHLTLLLGLPELAFRRSALPSYVRRVGPVLDDAPLPQPLPPWWQALGRDRPAVLVSTSSAWVDEMAFLQAAAEALASDDVDVVATVPSEHQLPPLPPNFTLTRFFPHGALLTKVRAVVCSGSFGLVTRAACAGVPVVAVPLGGDGYCVALAAAKVGVGIALDPDRFTARGLRSAVQRVLGDPSFAGTARRLGEAAAAYDAPTMAADAIDELLTASAAEVVPGSARS